jgi:DNA repair protein RadD
VCSVQTLLRRRWPEVDVLFVDEAHILSQAVKAKLEKKDCYAVGLSATPITRGLKKYFDVVVNAPPGNELIRMGRLVPIQVHSFSRPNMSGCDVSGSGEWTGQEAEKRVLQVVGDVVEKYLQDGHGRKFICFAWDIAHASELQRQFLAAGVNCARYTADDNPEDRHESVQEFKKPDGLRGLISVAALTRGFDETSVELLIDARPLRKAVHEYVQMLGRVMRSHPSKQVATVFDHSGNAIAFWNEWNDLFENGVTELDDGKPRKKQAVDNVPPKPVECPECHVVQKPLPFCVACGFEFPRKKAVQHVAGTLSEVLASGNRKTISASLWPQIVGYARSKRGDNGRGMALALYRQITGEWPIGAFEATLGSVPTKEVRDKILSLNIAYAKRKKADSLLDRVHAPESAMAEGATT